MFTMKCQTQKESRIGEMREKKGRYTEHSKMAEVSPSWSVITWFKCRWTKFPTYKIGKMNKNKHNPIIFCQGFTLGVKTEIG